MYRSRLSRIVVNDLFDKFNYEIDLENGDDVAIIIAPNGCGKTTIFNLLNFVFKPSFQSFTKIMNVPFDSITCYFDSNEIVRLAKFKVAISDYIKEENIQLKNIQAEMAGRLLKMMNKGNDIAYNYRLLITDSKGNTTGDIDFFDQLVNEYSALKSRGYEEDFEPEEEVVSAYGMDTTNRAHLRRFTYLFKEIEKHLEEGKVDIPIKFIETNRIQTKSNYSEAIYSRRHYMEDQKEPILRSKEAIDKEVAKRLDQYGVNKDLASEGLAKKYLEQWERLSREKIDYNTFVESWNDYIKDLEKYEELGLINISETNYIDFNTSEKGKEAYNVIGGYLNLLLGENEGNTSPLKEIYEKLNLFKSIFDSRNSVTWKKVFFTREGLKVYDCSNPDERKEIPLHVLSSGEKHDFVMFYELIFNAEPNSLILIDEPEISLHITWQEEFMDNLLTICNTNNMQSIVATHSPNIINGHFDLIVERQDG